MDAWLSMLLRQLIIYSLPVIISLTLIVWAESRLCRRAVPHPFFAIWWRGLWLPMLAAMAMHRGVIVAISNPLCSGLRAAAIRAGMHLLLALLGWGIYSLSLAYQAPTGVPPLHHWWAKVLMYFNLCMVFLHMLPLPNLLAGELLKLRFPVFQFSGLLPEWVWLMLLAASPLLDWMLGGWLIYPMYEFMANSAAHVVAAGG